MQLSVDKNVRSGAESRSICKVTVRYYGNTVHLTFISTKLQLFIYIYTDYFLVPLSCKGWQTYYFYVKKGIYLYDVQIIKVLKRTSET